MEEPHRVSILQDYMKKWYLKQIKTLLTCKYLDHDTNSKSYTTTCYRVLELQTYSLRGETAVLGLLNTKLALYNSLGETAVLALYNSLILSHINYGILTWGLASDRILKLQKKAMLSCRIPHRSQSSYICCIVCFGMHHILYSTK